jgi:hypothetical protein
MFKLDHFFKKLNKLGIKISNLKIGLMDRKFKTLVLDNLDQIEIPITISQNKLANEITEFSNNSKVTVTVLESQLHSGTVNFVLATKNDCYEIAAIDNFIKDYQDKITDLSQA